MALALTISALHYAVLGYNGYDPEPQHEALMSWAFTFLLALWCLEDAKDKSFHRPFEFGAFIFFAWPIVLPAYLYRTRGLKGMPIFIFIVILSVMPYLLGWLAYYVGPYYE